MSDSMLLSSDFVGSLRHNTGASLICSFHTDSSAFAPFIRPCSSGHSLLLWCLNQDVQIIDRHGNIKQTVQFHTTIRGFRITPDLRILVCGYLDKCIYQVKFGCRVTVYFKTALQPCDICPLGEDNVVVAVIDSSDYTTTDRSKRMVVKYNDSGQEVGYAYKDRFGGLLFNKPRRLSVNVSNTTTAVVNYTSDVSSHLVLLDSDMKLRCRFFGDGNVILANRKYEPSSERTSGIHDVCFDSEDNIIVADGFNKKVVLLSRNCDILRVLLTDELEPVSLCMNSDGELWCAFYKKGGGVVKIHRY